MFTAAEKVYSPIDQLPPYTPLEKARASVAGENAVMFATASVAADYTGQA